MSAPVRKPAAAPAAGAAKAAPAARTSLKATRRRLSVVSDNKLIEGLATLGAGGDAEDTSSRLAESVVKAYAGVSKKGYAPYNPRKRNQDSILMEEHKPTGTLLFGVFDGHGEAGDLVSHYFTDRLPGRLTQNPKFAADPGAAMQEEIDRLEKQLLADASIDTEFSGTTGVFGIVRGKKLIVANIGDSRVILGKKEGAASGGAGAGSSSFAGGKLKAAGVTEDHKPDREDEMRRILAAGGRVFAVEYEDGVDGPPRVWLGHMDIPGLAMSRSLGDTVAHTAGVISAPEMHVVDLGAEDKVMVWASDGLWEFCSNQEVMDMVCSPAVGGDPRKAVDALVAEANARWMKEEQVVDDTTVIVAFLQAE